MGRRSFTREFKLEAVKLVRERGVMIAQASRDLGLHSNVLRKWVKDSRENAEQAFPGRGKQRPDDAEVSRLRQELAKGVRLQPSAVESGGKAEGWSPESLGNDSHPAVTCYERDQSQSRPGAHRPCSVVGWTRRRQVSGDRAFSRSRAVDRVHRG